jgi:hypothetical protein
VRVQFVIESDAPMDLSYQLRDQVQVVCISPGNQEPPLYVAFRGESTATAPARLYGWQTDRRWPVLDSGPASPDELTPLAADRPQQGHSFVWSLPLSLDLHAAKETLIAMSRTSADAAVELCQWRQVSEQRRRVAEDWNGYFRHFPVPKVDLTGTTSLEEQLRGAASRRPRDWYLDADGQRRPQAARPAVDDGFPLDQRHVELAYHKALWHTRPCERIDAVWGATLTETFTSYYSGTFAWSAPVVGFYARRHFDPRFRNMMPRILDCYRMTQSPEGLLRCYVPFGWRP